MKRFTKFALILAAVFLAVGITCSIIGAVNQKDWGFPFWHKHIGLGTKGDDAFDDDDFDKLYNSDKKIEELTIEVEAGNLLLKPSGNNTCRVTSSVTEDISCSYTDGKLTIREDYKDDNWFHIGFFHDHGNTVVYLPDYVIDKVSICVAAGNVKLNELECMKLDASVEAGALYGNDTIECDECIISVSAGNIDINRLVADDGSISCDMGQFHLDSGILKKADIDCNVGNVDLSLDGEKDDYGLNINVDLGSVEIDGDHYSGASKDIETNGSNRLNIDCDLGSVSVDFKE